MTDEPKVPVSDAALRALLLEVIGQIAPETRGRDVADDIDLRDAFELDSMDLLAVLAGLKSRLGIDVPAADAARMATVNSAVTVLRELLP